jgi:hypothetical protein
VHSIPAVRLGREREKRARAITTRILEMLFVFFVWGGIDILECVI